jgi:hypothetical protein
MDDDTQAGLHHQWELEQQERAEYQDNLGLL